MHVRTHSCMHAHTHTHTKVLCLTAYVLLFKITTKVKAYAAIICSNQLGFYDALQF